MVTFTLNNAMNADYNATILFAVYDENDRMLGIVSKEVLVSEGELTELSLELSNYENWASVKAFLPLADHGYMPLCSSAVISANRTD